MGELEKGMLVQHRSLGLGKIVALEPRAVHVFFVGRDSRFAAKLRLPDALPLLRPADPGDRVWVGGLAAFTVDTASGRYGFAESWIPHDEALARFLETYPKGFADPRCAGDGKGRQGRPARLRSGQATFAAALGAGAGERMLAENAIGRLVEGALSVERRVGSHGVADGASLAKGLSDPEAARGFFAALFDYLASPAPEQGPFEALAAAVAGFPAEEGAQAWTLVTVLPALARPDRDVLLRPKLASQAALRLGLDLRFAPEPNWTTYSTFLRSCEQLLEKLRKIGARDLIDVETFLAVVTARPGKRARPAGEEGA